MNILVVGAGISGATVARCIAEKGHSVTIIDRRSHIAGNCFDYVDKNGLFIHQYGSHIFHTDNQEVWRFLSHFTNWYPYQHKVKALVDGQLVPVPFNLNSLEQLFPRTLARRIEYKLLSIFGFNVKVPILKLREVDDTDLNFLADYVYEKVFLGYTLKQWSSKPEELDKTVTGRVPVYISRDNRYFQNKYQGVPLDGYSSLIKKILKHKRIKTLLSTHFVHEMQSEFDYVYHTGPIDEYFNFCFGELPYRSLYFEFREMNCPYFQSSAVINYPCNYDFTRITEFKYFLNSNSNKTVVAFEYPCNFINGKNERYYPVPSNKNKDLYINYLNELKRNNTKVQFLGRLGDYQYYDMDKAVSRAIKVALRVPSK